MIHDTKPGKAKIGPAQTLQVNSGLLGARVNNRDASRWGDKRVTYRGRGRSKLEEQPLTIWQKQQLSQDKHQCQENNTLKGYF